MNIFIGKEHDRLHTMESSGSYEWWYFDAESDNGDWVITVIYFVGIPMSPYYINEYLAGKECLATNHTGIVVSVYHRGKRVGYSFIHGDSTQLSYVQKANHTYTLNIGLSQLTFDDNEYNLNIDTSSETWEHQSLQCKFSFKPNYSLPEKSVNSNAPTTNGESAHTWVLVAPDCNVEGEIHLTEYNSEVMKIPFRGRGYHDHNFGLRPLHKDWNEWYWGRIYMGNISVIFYITPQSKLNKLPNTENVQTIIVCQDGQSEIYSITSSTFDKVSVNLFGLKHYKKLRLKGRAENGKQIELEIISNTIMESAPFYMRSRITCLIKSDDSPNANNFGVMELYSPQKLLNPLFRSMVRTPFRKQVTPI
jgi:carotenoid 1,2-hydratase